MCLCTHLWIWPCQGLSLHLEYYWWFKILFYLAVIKIVLFYYNRLLKYSLVLLKQAIDLISFIFYFSVFLHWLHHILLIILIISLVKSSSLKWCRGVIIDVNPVYFLACCREHWTKINVLNTTTLIIFVLNIKSIFDQEIDSFRKLIFG